MTTEAECLDAAIAWLGFQMPMEQWNWVADVKVVEAIDQLYPGGWDAFREHVAQSDGVS